MTLLLSLAATAASAACGSAPAKPVVKRIVATPLRTATQPPSTPRPTVRATKSPLPQRSAVVARVPRSDDASGIEWPWIAIADCESGDGPNAAGPPYHPHWSIHDGTYDGGLQFAYSTWDSAWEVAGMSGPSGDAWQHDAATQVKVAKAWLAVTSWDQWPVCSRAVGVR